MDQFKNQVVVINGVSYFITDDIEGLDISQAYIQPEAIDLDQTLSFIQTSDENIPSFDLTDEFFGVIEGLPEKTKKAFFKAPSEIQDNVDSQTTGHELEITTIPITFDLSGINVPAASSKSSGPNIIPQRRQIITVQKPRSTSNHVTKTVSPPKQSNSIAQVCSDIGRAKQQAMARDPKKCGTQSQDTRNLLKRIREKSQNKNSLASTVSEVLKSNQIEVDELLTVVPQVGQDKVIYKVQVQNNPPEHSDPDVKVYDVSQQHESGDEQENKSFLSNFSTGAKLSELQCVEFEPNVDRNETNKPLGSSENPIQLIQKGAKFHSLQPLSSEQLQQVASILRQQNRKELLKNSENVVFDKKTNTKIVCKIVYPDDVPHVRKKGRPPRAIPVRFQKDELISEEEDVNQEKEKKGEIKRTRCGRLSKPPRHVVKDYKRLHKLDQSAPDLDDSDGGYSDYDVPPEERGTLMDEFPDAPRRKKRKLCTNYRCLTCQKVYLGIGKLATHYLQNSSHGTIEHHLEYIAKHPLYTKDMPEQQEPEKAIPTETSPAPVDPLALQPPETRTETPRVAPTPQEEEPDPDPIVEALKPSQKKKRGRPAKNDEARKLVTLRYGLISAANALSTFDAYASLVPRLVEISPFEHVLSCSKAKRIQKGAKGSLVPFVLEEMERLLHDLKKYVDEFMTLDVLEDHDTYEVTSTLLTTVCDLSVGAEYFLKDGKKQPPPPPAPIEEACVDQGAWDRISEKADKSPERAFKVFEKPNETLELFGSEESSDRLRPEQNSDSISDLFPAEKGPGKEVSMLDLFEPERGALHDKNNSDSVFEFFRDRKESLSISDIPVDTAALRQVDDIVDQVASQAGELLSHDNDYRSPSGYRASPASVHSSYRNSPAHAPSPRDKTGRENNVLTTFSDVKVPSNVSHCENAEDATSVSKDSDGDVPKVTLCDVIDKHRPFKNVGSTASSKAASPVYADIYRKTGVSSFYKNGRASLPGSENASPAEQDVETYRNVSPVKSGVSDTYKTGNNVLETYQNVGSVENNVAKTYQNVVPTLHEPDLYTETFVENVDVPEEEGTFDDVQSSGHMESNDDIMDMHYEPDAWWKI